MVAFFRAMRRSRVLALLLAWLTLLGTSGSWHVDNDDPDCAAPVAHDHSAHHERFNRATATEAPAHCAICHWLQAFRAGAVRQPRVPFVSASARVSARPLVQAIRSADRLALPSRAPPLNT